ncbi:META domain-containing protein [Leisingera sp. D0M16]|uniref:META domain-containing protein n=1 Tax=Leisingera coralii TaxID=3351347 RepID=UPI003B7BAE15
MLRLILLQALLLIAACTGDETLSAYGAAGKFWRLQSIDGAAYTAAASLRFPEPGTIAGQAPCNSFKGKQTAPYPWFAVEALAVTRAACPGLKAEAAFLQALQAMTLAEVSGRVLILSNGQGREMLFTAGG